MRKFIALAACLILFTACKGKDEPVVLENPQQTFNELSVENRESWKVVVMGLLPEMEAFEKSKSTFSVKGKANMDGAGSLDFDFNAASEADMANKEDPLMKTAIDASAVLDGEPFKGNASASLELIVANASVFMSIKELTVDFPAYPTSEILDPIKQHLGKWYGDTFVSINEKTGTDIQETYLSRMNNPAELHEKLGDLITETDLFTMKSFLGEEDGFYKFDVELNKAELRAFTEGLMDFSVTSESQKQEALAEFDKEIATVSINGTLAYMIDDPKYFTFDGTVTDTADTEKNGTIVASFLEDNKSLRIGDSEGSVTIAIENQDEVNAFSIKQSKSGEEEKEIAKGTISETNIDATVFDPDSGSENIKIVLAKVGDIWSGTITGYESDSTTDSEEETVTTVFVMEITNLTIDKNNFKADLLLKDEDNKELATVNIDYQSEEVDSVSVVSPESFEQFGTLLENFLPLMMMSAPGLGAQGAQFDSTAPSAGIPGEEPGSDSAVPEITSEAGVGEIPAMGTSLPTIPLSDQSLPPDVAAELQKSLEEMGIETE